MSEPVETEASIIPELGPLLGRLAAPAGTTSGLVPLDDVRLSLVTELFQLAGAARAFAADGDLDSALQSLNRHGWQAAWERAVTVAAARVAMRIEQRFSAASVESRLPRRKLRKVMLTDDERRGIAVRLGSGGGALVEALDRMELLMRRAVRDAAGTSDAGALWRNALTGVARRLESAWFALEDAARAEEAAWQEDVGQVREWKRPRLPLWVMTLAIAAVLFWAGLVLGGFLASPDWFRPVAERIWGIG
jgi:hypothetical protein